MLAVRPYPSPHKCLLIIHGVHEPDKALAQTDWVKDIKMNLSGRLAGEQPRHHGLHEADCGLSRGMWSLYK